MSSPSISKLDSLPPEMNEAFKAAQDFMQRHPDLKPEDALYERSIAARVVIAYHERLAEAVSQCETHQRIYVKDVDRLTAERNNYVRRLYQRESENWKQVCAPEVFQVGKNATTN